MAVFKFSQLYNIETYFICYIYVTTNYQNIYYKNTFHIISDYTIFFYHKHCFFINSAKVKKERIDLDNSKSWLIYRPGDYIITRQDVDPKYVAFKAFLHFIYCDDLFRSKTLYM
jgi:hypothetical protein